MFRNKRELDLHVQDVLSKLQGEREKSMRCFNIAKQYAAMKEFPSAKRHMERYLTTNPSNAADALKLMGDFTVETGDLDKALDYYKSSYKHRKNREALSRICDLLERGCGTKEDQRNGNQKWFELLKATDATPNSSPLPYYHDSNPISTTNVHRSSLGAGQSKSVFSINNRPHLQTSTPIKSIAQVVNGIGSHGDTFAPKITSSPEKADSPIINLERRYDDILAKILGTVQRIENDMKDLRGKVENLQKESEKASISAKAAENSSKPNDSTDAKQKAVNENSFFPHPQLPHVSPYFQPNPAFGFGFPYQALPFHNPYFNTNPMLAALYGNPLLGNPLAGLGVPRNGVPQAATVLPNETSLLAGLLSQNQFIPPSSLNSLGTQPVESLYPQVPLQASMAVNSSLTDKLWQQPQQELPTVTVGQSIFSNPNSLSVTSISSIVNPVNTLKLGTEDKSNITANQPVVAAPPSKIETTETRQLSSATTATFAAVSKPSFAAVSKPTFTAVSLPTFAAAVTTPAFAAVSKATITAVTTPTFGSTNTATLASAATPTSTLATNPTLSSATTPKLISATTPTITSALTPVLATAVTPVLASAITPVSAQSTTPVSKKEIPKDKTLFPENVVVSNTEKVPTVPSSSYSNIMSVTIPPEHRNTGTGSSSSILTNTHSFQISAPTFKSLEPSIDKKSEANVNPFSNIALKASTAISFGDLASNGIASGFGGKNSFEGGAKEVFANVVASQSAAGDAVVRHDKDRVDGDETVDDFVPTLEFQPVIPLPPLVEVKKGNENENKLFEHRAKIYRFVKETKEWKERGVGNIMILQDKDDDRKIRVVMWRERVYKLACNHRITKDLVIEYHQESTKVLKWTAMDFADGESDGKLEIFTCRFGQEEKCAEFKATMERMIAFLATKGESSPQKEATKVVEQPKTEMKPLTELFKKAAGSWDCEACYVNNSERLSKCLSCGTPKPSPQSAKVNVAEQPKAELKPFSELFKKPSGSWDCGTCYVNNAEKDTKCVSCGTAKPFVFQPSFGQFGSKEEKKSGIEKPATSLDDKVKELNTNAFSGINLAAASAPSFGDLAKNAASTGFSVWQSKPFAGSGAPVFGFSAPVPAQPTPAPAVVGGSSEVESKENEDTVEEFVPTAEFQPVIPLPPLVVVKKGNENENVLFEHRAKIYRFVKATKEWKERGVGNIMILQDKDNERKIRVVMWRERVYKLACNHRITKDLVIENHQGSPKVLKWTAMDFADGESDGKMEIFTCRFGQEDKCAEFKATMERMIAFLTTQGESSPQAEKTMAEEPRNVEQKPLSEMFKKSAGSWDCGACYVNNTEKDAKCVSCGTANPLSIAQKQSGTWQCETCSTIQNEESVKCVNCGTAKAGHPCSGCRGCDPDSFDFGELDKRVLPICPKETIQKIPDSSGENQLDKINSQKCTPIADSQIYEMLTPDTSPKKITEPASSDSAPNSSAAPSQFKFGFSGINNSSVSNDNTVISSPKFNFQFNPDTSLGSVSSPVIKVPQFKFGFTETANTAPITAPFKPLETPQSDLSSATTVNQEPSISINPNIFVPSDESQQISSTSVGDGNEADNDNDNDNEYDDANDEEDALFESDAHLFTSESLDSNAGLDDVGNGLLRIIYDGEQLCSRLYFMKDEEIVIDHIIAAETALEPAGDLAFEWFGVNEIDETAIKIKMRVKLPNYQTSDEFSRTMAESTEYAVKALVKESCLLGYD